MIVVDPMLATGNSAIAAIVRLKERGAHDTASSACSPRPRDRQFHGIIPDVPIVDRRGRRRLNEHGYIVPGLGDAGDRLFGTK